MPETPYSPPAAPVQQPADEKGSLGAGIAIAWACLIGGYVVCGVFVSAVASIAGSAAAAFAPLLALAPWVAMIVLIIRLSGKGKSRTALGIGVGMGSIVGVGLLLVAACFGLLSNTNFH